MILTFLATVFVIATVLPFVRSDYWTFRSLEYPRQQKLFAGLALLAASIVLRESLDPLFWWLVLPLATCIIYLLVKVLPYTMLYAREMKKINHPAGKDQLKILTANVLQDNRQYDRLLALIRSSDPDLVLLLETDENWSREMAVLDEKYPFRLKKPQDNTYGMLFFSRLQCRNARFIFRVQDDVPSLEAEVQLPAGDWIKIYGLHPRPPVPEESLYSTPKDKELMKVALETKKLKQPCIVMGDLNDVAWSHVTTLFRKVSGLLDPRRGRGFFSTFSAFHWWFRFPLDYIFCSRHFQLVAMRRLPAFGSDHFPMFIHLQLCRSGNNNASAPQADQEEKEEAKEKANV